MNKNIKPEDIDIETVKLFIESHRRLLRAMDLIQYPIWRVGEQEEVPRCKLGHKAGNCHWVVRTLVFKTKKSRRYL